MLRHIALENFKSFASAEASIAPFTLLVGANASGKSNFLDALRFLHGMAQGWPIPDVVGGRVEGGTKVWNGIRGGTHEVVRAGAERFRLTSDWSILGDLFHHVVETDGRTIQHEEMGNLFTATRPPGSQPAGRDLVIEWLPGSLQPQIVRAASGTSAICTPLALSNGFAAAFAPTLRNIRFLDLQTRAMRDYSERSRGSRLADDGSNLSSVIWAACQDTKLRSELVDWLVELCSPEIVGIDFDETQSGDVLLRVVELGGAKITAKSLSDGTLRFLGLLAALKTLRHDETLVVEDLDHGLHPSRLRLLVEAIDKATQRLQPDKEVPTVIATTHSPTLLEAALDARFASLLLFARPGDGHGSIIRDIRTLPNLDDVRKRRDLHYLLNTGWMERAI